MSTKPKHTPGPWSIAPGMPCCVWTDAVETGRGVAVTAMNARPPEEQIANACLIAAAPELFAALESCRASLEVLLDFGDLNARPKFKGMVERDIKAAIAAIKSAKGGA
ncbi:MAG: hypothetical protein H7067_03765 [Burkholderiales bacterium]|nr:hypothetical protein [Opitutaceae bacterium]